MPSLKMAISHALGQEEAVRRLKEAIAGAKAKLEGQFKNLEESWAENLLAFGFTAYGFSVKGTVTVEPSEVHVASNLPFAAMMFKGLIQQTLKDELGKVLA